MNLRPSSWPNSLLFFRKRHKPTAEVSPDGPLAETVSVTVIATGLTTPATPLEPDIPAHTSAAELNIPDVGAMAATVSPPAEAESESAKPRGRLLPAAIARSSARAAALLSMSTSMPSLDQVIGRIRDLFNTYLPATAAGLPDALLSIVGVTERSVGIGGHIGNQPIGTFGQLELKGVRLEVVLRFQLYANSTGDMDSAVQNLIAQLLADRDSLRSQGVLRLSLKNVGASETADLSTFWQTADFVVLYEEPFLDNSAESLIARIPVTINSEFNETMTLTDEMARWDDTDDTGAPPLIVRGPLQIAVLSALYSKPAVPPTGSVTLRRTFDGAPGPASAHATFNDFLAAITDPAHPDRDAEFVFSSLSGFLAEFSVPGGTVELTDDVTVVQYDLSALEIDPPINLRLAIDRFEIVYADTKFDKPAVLYLRAAHSITT